MEMQLRHYLSPMSYRLDESRELLRLAHELKASPLRQDLAGRSIGLLFFNQSLRTRSSMAIGAYQLGAFPLTLDVGVETWGLEHREGIVMDGELLSAPNIRSTITNNGIIEGEFTREEVQLLVDVLKAGKLPSALKKDPISDQEVSAILGADTVRKGKIAISISFGAVLVFMALYYRFAGLVACMALCLNLLLIVAMFRKLVLSHSDGPNS